MNSSLAVKIASAIAPHRKMTERMVGAIPYTLIYELHEYTGESQKPGNLSSIEKCITKLVNKGVNTRKEIGDFLGLDSKDELEKDILLMSIDYAKKHSLITSDAGILSITQEGKDISEGGEYIVKYTNNFSILLVPGQLSFLSLNQCNLHGKLINKKPQKYQPAKLSIEQIRDFADAQASHTQHRDSGLHLVKAEETRWYHYSYEFYICFLQSIKDNSVRTIVYDDKNNTIITPLSGLFDESPILRDDLLGKCLAGEAETQEIKEVESGEKTEEQIKAEASLIEKEENGEEEIPTSNSPKPGTVLDSFQFEKQLQDIFRKHHNEEIWMISPWIRDYAFLNHREPLIRSFLEKGGAIFIAYSEPERLGEEMVDPQSKAVIRRLERNYEKFYVIQMPKFHHKNVIEYKNDETVLYSGSFNVLSFSVNGNAKHYRMEDMMVSNEEEAIKKRETYLREFAKIYIKSAHFSVSENGDYQDSAVNKLKYFKEIQILDEVTEIVEKEFEEIGERERETIKDKMNVESKEKDSTKKIDYSNIADKIIRKFAPTDIVRIKGILAALTYANDHTEEGEKKEWIRGRIVRFINNENNARMCRFTLRPDKEDRRKSIVAAIIDGVCYEFSGISLPKETFRMLIDKKEIINYKEEGLKNAKYIIEDLMFEAIEELGPLLDH